MAKETAKPGETKPASPATWTLEDMPALAEQVDAFGAIVEKLKPLLESIEGRLGALEKKAVNLDIEDRILPSEVVAGLSPAAVYQAALTGAVVATCMAVPSLPNHKEVVRRNYAKSCSRFAMEVLQVILSETPSKKKAG